jgi:hypothetical protein
MEQDALFSWAFPTGSRMRIDLVMLSHRAPVINVMQLMCVYANQPRLQTRNWSASNPWCDATRVSIRNCMHNSWTPSFQQSASFLLSCRTGAEFQGRASHQAMPRYETIPCSISSTQARVARFFVATPKRPALMISRGRSMSFLLRTITQRPA